MEILRAAIYLTGFLKTVSGDYCSLDEKCDERNLVSDFLLLTVSTNETDGYKRYMESAETFKLPVKVLGMGDKWEGGNMNYKGGGQKVNLVRKALKSYRDDETTIVMFTDSYDVMLLGTADEMVRNFKALNAGIVFSAEVFCWPDESLANDYPKTESPYKYLNSGGYIGYANQLYDLLQKHKLKNKDDDQLYFTNLFLTKELREKYKMRLDHKATIFQSANGATGELKLIKKDDDYVLYNEVTKTYPLVLHGNGPSKLFLNLYGNYLAKARSATEMTCLNCPSLNEDFYTNDLPIILMGLFINVNTPFIDEFFERINELDYPKNKLHLFVYNGMKYHNDTVNAWISQFGAEYLSLKKIGPDDTISESLARDLAIERCKLKNCKYLFVVDSVVQLEDKKTLLWLLQDQKGVVGPVLTRPLKAWSNFWGALSPEGYYARSFDYLDIVHNEIRGLWNVPYITNCYLINATLLPQMTGIFEKGKLDPDMNFCKNLRDMGIFMYAESRIDAGHLTDAENFDVTLASPDLYEIFYNQFDWEKRYIHPDYSLSLEDDFKPFQPCPDVYWFPIVTPRFCKELINVVERFGKWSSGSNYDERLVGGYENVPTRDIHMNQVDFERHWLYFLQQYVRPLQEKVFIGYYHDPPKSLMNFVVRYKPDEQPSLRPHHDSSTYTINLALNQRGIDYEGGGCKFIRYNCSVQDTKVGWLLMHPGRLTHYHEGLLVTNGTRYIMISFVDP